METNVRHILETKGNDIWWIAPEESVYEAIRLMAEKGVGLLVVMKERKIVGVISERDYARKIILEGRSSRETSVADIMTSKVVFGDLNLSTTEGLSMMTDGHFRHLPILDGGEVVGVLSIGDFVKAVIADQQFRIEQLEGYISS